MNCDEIELLLHGYMDGELDAVTNRSVEEHLADCPSCTRELASFRDLHSALRQDGLYHRAPVTVVNKVRAGSRRSQDVRPVFRWRTFAAAASICVVFLGVWGVGHLRPASVDPVDAEIVDSHVRSLMLDHLVDVKSSDKHTVKPWFDGKLDFAPPVERLDGTEFPLLGGRLDYIDGHSAAAVVYRHNKHLINLFIWPVNSPDKPPVASSERGYNIIHWSNHGMTFWATSDISPTDLSTFADLIRHGQ